MRWMAVTALLSIVVFLPGGRILWAQKQPAQPAASKDDPVRAFVPPAASKSVEIGDFYLKRKKYKAALSRFQEALRTDPHYAPAYRELGKVYEKMGFWQKSLDAYREYLDELPSAKDAREAKDIHKAIARLQQEIFAEGPSSAGRQ
jgi:tetratricopeptide (TPR) repeat protein